MFPEDDKPMIPDSPSEGSTPAKDKPKKEKAKKAPAEEGAAEQPQAAPKKEKAAKPKKGEGRAAEAGEKGDKKKEKSAAEKPPADYQPRLLTHYRSKVVPDLMKRFSYKNTMMVPRLEKITLNVGIGEASQNPKLLESAVKELGAITGQKAAITRARLSISNFKLRKGMAIGCRVTLRRWQMFEFLDRFMSVAIPRIRDFRGLSDRSFDGRGNYTIGLKEQIIFPEIDIDKIERMHGLDITFVTSAKTDEEAQALLLALGVPFRRHSGEGRELAA